MVDTIAHIIHEGAETRKSCSRAQDEPVWRRNRLEQVIYVPSQLTSSAQLVARQGMRCECTTIMQRHCCSMHSGRDHQPWVRTGCRLDKPDTAEDTDGIAHATSMLPLHELT